MINFFFMVWAQTNSTPFLTEPLETQTISIQDKVLKVERGQLVVPTIRTKETRSTISLPFYRLASAQPVTEAAVFILAGGPGSSGIQNLEGEEHIKEIAFYRSFADVVVFDQRGTGGSTPSLICEKSGGMDISQPIQGQQVMKELQRMGRECREALLLKGVDLSGYNTDENAADVNDLRRVLGYSKMILVGGSYGSHLGLHVMRKYPEFVQCAVFYGLEGPDHTYDLPTQRWAALQRIAADVQADPIYGPKIPSEGLMNLWAQTFERLRNQPVLTRVRMGDTEKSVWVNEFALSMVLDYKAGKRSTPYQWPDLILACAQGDYSLPGRAIASLSQIRGSNAMKYLMDTASGLSPTRLNTIQQDEKALLMPMVNLDLFAQQKIWIDAKLPEPFHRSVSSDLPVLLIQGTWDYSTPLENAHEVLAHLTRGKLIEVIGGSHGALYNLYEHWPPAREKVKQFMLEGSVDVPKQVDLGLLLKMEHEYKPD